jgi:serine/threonine protein kinase
VTAPRLNAGGIIAGKYTVRSILGNSGAVITYQCANPQGQEVAVKLYDPAVASHATVMKSLEQAYAATNALPQNSAAPIVDAGYDQPTLAPFSVTEMLRLPSLQSLQRRLPPEEVVALLKGLARSLDLAHVRNVVHGAIKPTNVFVGPACNPTIVTDFAANLPKAAVPTQEGFVQSAPWIAPEQAQSGSVTPAADVFSVGLLVFFALTGRTYWRSTQGQTFDLNGWQQELGAPRGPASQRAMELGVALSPTLDIVLWKALSNDPQERYKSIGEFASAIEDTMMKQVGSAATMALPMVGDAPSPSPLPSNMQNPERAPALHGAAGPQGPATVAFPAEAFQAPPNLPTQAMSLQQLQAHQMAMHGAPAPGMSGPGMSGPNMGGPNMGGPNMGGPNMGGPGGGYGMNGPGMNGGLASTAYANPPPVGGAMADAQYGYSQQASREGYPPPPAPALAGPAPSKSKVLPVALVFTAVALLGVVGMVVFLRLRAETPASDAPVKVEASGKPTASAAPDASPPPSTATSTETSAPMATTQVKQVELRVKCKPVACQEVKVDGTAVDLTKPVMVAPGSREVEVSKAGFVGQTEKVEVKEGSAFVDKTFLLAAEKQATTAVRPPPPPPPPGTGKKPCKVGGFIKKCP